MNAIWISAIVVFVLSASALYFTREPNRNGYQKRRRTRIKGARTIVTESNHPIVGDGAWKATQAEYPEGEVGHTLPRRPRTARVRDLPEPMGF